MGASIQDLLEEGRLFTVSHTSPSIAAAGNYLIGIKTGGAPVQFLDRAYISSASDVLVELFELTYTAGTVIPSGNRNFVSDVKSPVEFVAAPTATVAGNPVATVRLLSTTGTGAAQVGLQSEAEAYIVKPNKLYVLRLTNNGTQAGFVSLRFTFRNNTSISAP